MLPQSPCHLSCYPAVAKRALVQTKVLGATGRREVGTFAGRLVCFSEQSRPGSLRQRELPGLWVPGGRQDRSRPITTHAQSSRGGSEGGRALLPRAQLEVIGNIEIGI